jgi:hypothetical protein
MQTDLISLLQSIPAIGPVVPYALMAAGVASSVMPWLPVPSSSNSLYGTAYGLLNLLGQNYRNAANAPAAPSAPGPAVN